MIKSIQRGAWSLADTELNGDKTITAIELGRMDFAAFDPSVVFGSAGEANYWLVASVTNSTTVNLSRNGSAGTSAVYQYQIVEEYRR